MKRILTAILTIIMISLTTTIYASDQSYKVELVPSKIQIKPGEEFEVTLKIGDFKNITEGIYAFSAKIVYDTDIFEEITEESFTAQNKWSSPTFNAENGKITSDISTGVKEESDILKIKIKVKDNAEINSAPEIKLTEFKASEGDKDIDAQSDATISVKIVSSSNNGDNNNDDNNNNDNTNKDDDNNGGDNNDDNNGNNSNSNNGNNNSNNSNNNNNSSNSETNNNNTKKVISTNSTNAKLSSRSLPKAGIAGGIIITAIITAIVGIVSYIKYKRTY